MARRRANLDRLLGKLAQREEQFLSEPFLAPALPNAGVRVRLGGVICKLTTAPRDYCGWGVFQPRSFTEAALISAASPAQRRQYLELLLRVRLVICQREGNVWQACAASFGDERIRIEGLVPVQLAEEVQSFDVVYARYDGTTFWFDEPDLRSDPRHAVYLREQLSAMTAPNKLDRLGLSAELRAAYEVCLCQEVEAAEARRLRAIERDPIRNRLRAQLSHAGAELLGYVERGDGYRVTYRIDGRQMTSSVNKDMTVQVAGICLDGMDRDFDLGSLVGVLRQQESAYVQRVGQENNGVSEEDYWRAHPPR